MSYRVNRALARDENRRSTFRVDMTHTTLVGYTRAQRKTETETRPSG